MTLPMDSGVLVAIIIGVAAALAALGVVAYPQAFPKASERMHRLVFFGGLFLAAVAFAVAIVVALGFSPHHAATGPHQVARLEKTGGDLDILKFIGYLIVWVILFGGMFYLASSLGYRHSSQAIYGKPSHNPRIYLGQSFRFATIADIYKGRTDAEAQKLVEVYTGKWIKIRGRLKNITIRREYSILTIERDISGPLSRLSFEFGKKWRSQLETIQIGDEIKIAGWIGRPERNLLWIRDCELISEEEARDAISVGPALAPTTGPISAAVPKSPQTPAKSVETSKPQPAKSERVVLPPSVSPIVLMDMFAGRTDVEGGRLTAPFLNKWMKIRGRFRNLASYSERCALDFEGPSYPQVQPWFPAEAIVRLETIRIGEHIAIMGRVDRITRHYITLEDCELIPLSEADGAYDLSAQADSDGA